MPGRFICKPGSNHSEKRQICKTCPRLKKTEQSDSQKQISDAKHRPSCRRRCTAYIAKTKLPRKILVFKNRP